MRRADEFCMVITKPKMESKRLKVRNILLQNLSITVLIVLSILTLKLITSAILPASAALPGPASQHRSWR